MTGKHAVRTRPEAARQAIAARHNLRETPQLLYYAYLLKAADAVFGLLIVAAELRERAPTVPACHCGISSAVPAISTNWWPRPWRGTLPTCRPSPARSGANCAISPPRCRMPAPRPYRAALAMLARFPAFDTWRAAHQWPRPSLRHSWQRWRTAVGEHLARDALAGRHALRLALAGGLSLLPARVWRMNHGYWVAVTVIMVLSPQLTTTRQISLKRFAGSLAGATLACAVGLAHPSEGLALLLSAAFLAGAYAFGAWRVSRQASPSA